MVGVVLDSSVVLSWCLPDEGVLDPDDVQILVAARGAIVPGHWSLEVANVLLMAERRGRIDAHFRRAALDDLALLPITVDIETPARAWPDISKSSRNPSPDRLRRRLSRAGGAQHVAARDAGCRPAPCR